MWFAGDKPEVPDGDRAAKLRQISGGYDNWFIAVKPLISMDPLPRKGLLKHGDELLRAIEEVRGGIRLGRSNDVSVDVALVENFAVRAEGRIVSLSFSIDDSRLQEPVNSLRDENNKSDAEPRP